MKLCRNYFPAAPLTGNIMPSLTGHVFLQNSDTAF